jgi:NAD(P)-dependent dehydrogenase (short-subunit alcohol dehydrogenase family)
MSNELKGRVALVTGGGRGLGRAVARALAVAGADVAVAARTAGEITAVADELRALGVRALAVPCDLGRAGEIERLCESVRTQLSPPTILVLNAAALWQPARLHNVDADERRRLLSVDVDAAVELAAGVAPSMLDARWGRIVAVSSLAARTGISGGALYSASKAFLEGLVRGLAVDYSRFGITANAVAAGFIATERLEARLAGNDEQRAKLERATATRKLPTPTEIADVVAFLCSPRASAITGAVIDATAGSHLNNLW